MSQIPDPRLLHNSNYLITNSWPTCKQAVPIPQLLLKDKVDSDYYENEAQYVVPFKALFEYYRRKDHERRKCNGFLYGFQLHKIEWSTLFFKAHAVCRYLEQVFKEGQSPA